MFKLRHGMLLTLVILTTGCANLKNPLNWGGLFGKKACEGESCEQTNLLDQTNANQEWYCYGKKDGSDWECENSRDPSKIVSVTPRQRSAATESARAARSEQAFVEPVASQAAAMETKPLRPRALSGEERILNQPNNFYAVQLLALQEQAGVLKYANRNGLADPLFAKINSQGTDWYVLLLGIYSDRSSAVRAKTEWERAKTLKVKPWIRQLGPLQNAIEAAR